MNPVINEELVKGQGTTLGHNNSIDNADLDTVLARRIREVREGKVQLVSSADTAAEIRARYGYSK
ncbi:MAG: hypothetical protein QM632_02850 [Micrococcaceae bacterium]